MLSTLLIAVPWLAALALLGVVVVGPVAGALLARHRRALGILLAVALLAVAAATMYPDGAPGTAVRCAATLPRWSPTAVETVANVLLFVPPALLAGVLTRRPVRMAIAGCGLSALVEATQALVPAIGRACDTSDLVTNSVGALLGGMLAIAALAIGRRRDRRTTAR